MFSQLPLPTPIPTNPGAARKRVLAIGLLALTGLLGARCPVDKNAAYQAEVRRSDGGIPHIRALDYASLGYGTAYAMAQDNLCLMADQFLTNAAERSLFHGPDGGNLSSDFFHQFLLDRGDAEEAISKPLEKLFRGAAAGYNRYLREARSEHLAVECAGADWLREVSAADFRRVTRSEFLFPYFSGMLIAAYPPETAKAAHIERAPVDPAAALAVGGAVDVDRDPSAALPAGMGSNAMALGRDVTRNGRGLLLANPHQRWHGAQQRFHALHQTLPGELDVVGANQISRPNVGFGTSEHVAWTSTVSTASRYSFYQLTLVPGDPTTYLFDGEPMAMTGHTVKVAVRKLDGSIGEASHTFYSTHFGAFLVAGRFPWTTQVAFAARFTESGWRGAEALLPQYRATSVAELKAVHDAYQFLPVNLIAADGAGQTLYADPGPVPNLPDATLAECSVFRGAALDGSRSACQWQTDADAVAPGIYAPANLPTLTRSDYVANSNDTYWLANPNAPLSGFNSNLGKPAAEQTLRSRTGLEIVEQRIAGSDGLGDAGFSLEHVQTLALQNRNKGGELLREAIVQLCSAHSTVELANSVHKTGKRQADEARAGRAASPPDGPTTVRIDIREACPILANWDARSDLGSVGAVLFRETLRAGNGGRRLPADWKFRVPFDAADPMNTPRDLDPNDNPAVLQALAESVQRLRAAGIPLDAALGDVQSVTRNGERIPIHGGEEFEGVYNKVSADFAGAAGYPEVTGTSSSWIQATEFGEDGPRIRALLTYSLSADENSPHFADQTKRYSDKNWVEIPFRHDDVVAATLSHVDLREGAGDCAATGWQAFARAGFADETECRAYFERLRDDRIAEMKARYSD